MSSQADDPRFPAELLIAVFAHLDGCTLAACAAVCRQWNGVVNNYDDLLWKACAQRDFQHGSKRRFWSLHFPDPKVHNSIGRSPEQQQARTEAGKRTWQDMYRITRNWFAGNCEGFFPKVEQEGASVDSSLTPHVVVGTPQEHTFFTTLTVTSTGHIVRSNPTYRRPDGPQSIQIQSPRTREMQYLDQQPLDGAGSAHTVFCHYSHPSSKWLVTGSLDGTVALWDVIKQQMVHLWEGHRGRVLCVGMNDDVVVSGGSDSMLRVWDLADHDLEARVTTARRGMIDISSYLSASSDWIQGVGEIAVGEHLVACSPDASGPVLVFSLLTGSLVYELGSPRARVRDLDWGAVVEEMTGFTKLCLTPYFLLTKGKLPAYPDDIPVLPRQPHPPASQHRAAAAPRFGYIASLDESPCSPPPPAAQMTPYQLYRYYQSLNASSSSSSDPPSYAQQQPERTAPANGMASGSKQIRSCINVWDLESGNIVYRLAPQVDSGYIITDIRASPDSSKVFACVEIRARQQRREQLYCWDFAGMRRQPAPSSSPRPTVVQIDGRAPPSSSTSTAYRQSVGNSWACFIK